VMSSALAVAPPARSWSSPLTACILFLFGSTCLLCPKLIHANKSGRVLCLKNVPTTEVGHSLVVWKSTPVTLADTALSLKAEKL
jgi:hypothetical protein